MFHNENKSFNWLFIINMFYIFLAKGNANVLYRKESLPTLLENQTFRISETNTPSAIPHRIKRFFDYEGEEDDNKSLEEGEFPSKLEEDVEEFIHRMHQAYTITDGEALNLKCANELTQRIFDVFPKATYRWTLNNKAFSMDPARMIMMAGVLLFQAVFVEDSGVYVCGIEYSPKVIKTVSFYSLVVTNPEPTVRIQATKPFELLCPSQFISTIYPHSVRSWALNGVIYKELHKIPSKKNGADLIPALEADMTGKWTCEVREPMGGKLWTVAFYHLRVDIAPPFWQQTLDSVKKNIIPLSVFSAIAVGGILTVLLLMVYKTAKEDADQDIAIESLKGKMAELKKGGVELNPESSSDSDSDSEGVGLNNVGGNGSNSKEVGLNSDGNSYPDGDALSNGSDIGGDSDSEGTRLNNESTNDSDSESD